MAPFSPTWHGTVVLLWEEFSRTLGWFKFYFYRKLSLIFILVVLLLLLRTIIISSSMKIIMAIAMIKTVLSLALLR